MKSYSFLIPAVGSALVLAFTSCSQNSGYADAETAQAIAGSEIPPWIAEGSGSSYETGGYASVDSTSAYAYDPPAKPKTSTASTSKSKPKPKSTAKRPTPSTKTYTVKKGDTLGAIARRNGTSVKAIKSANGLKSDLIRINQKLKIPRGK